MIMIAGACLYSAGMISIVIVMGNGYAEASEIAVKYSIM